MYMASGVVDVRVTGAVGTIRAQPRRSGGTRCRGRWWRNCSRHSTTCTTEKRVRAVVLTGAGTAFCAGMDVHEMHSLDGLPDQEKAQQWGDAAEAYRELVAQMIELPKPIIASVNGPAVAGGAGLVLACDIVVAGEAAQFGLPDPRRGVVAGVVGPLLAFRVGAGPAARLLLTSSLYPAAEAFRLGIYHEMIDENRLWARAWRSARSVRPGRPRRCNSRSGCCTKRSASNWRRSSRSGRRSAPRRRRPRRPGRGWRRLSRSGRRSGSEKRRVFWGGEPPLADTRALPNSPWNAVAESLTISGLPIRIHQSIEP